MNRSLGSLLLLALFLLPVSATADERLVSLEAAAPAINRLQPGLENFRATIVTDRIAATIQSLTAGMPPDAPRPEVPTVVKYWRRGNPEGLIVAEGAQSLPYIQKMVQHFSSALAIDPSELLLPAGAAEERQKLTATATVKNTETRVADSVLQRVDIVFPGPAEIGDAFYSEALRLPRKGIVRLTFDIDTATHNVTELAIHTAEGLHLVAEFRYQEVAGGSVPSRVRVTSLDGSIDDLLEVSFTEVGGFLVPASILRVLQRPDLRDRLEVAFRDYRINQPFPAGIDAAFSARKTVSP